MHLMGRQIALPRSRLLRVALGSALVVLGLFFGFLPILGYWMVPVGLLVLSYDIAAIRRLRRRAVLWWERRKRR
jgi:purine-cytosine permease-like protein